VVLLLALAATQGCDDENGGPGGQGTDTGDSGGEPSDPWDLGDVFGVANVDDDDGNGVTDWNDAGPAGEDDYALFTVPAALRAGVGEGESLVLSLGGSIESIRIWQAGTQLMGSGGTSHTLPAGSDDQVFEVEFAEFLDQGDLTLQHLDASGAELRSVTVSLQAAPLLLNHHLQPADHLWIIEMNWGSYSNADMVADLEQILGSDHFTAVNGSPYNYDVWIQDELEFALNRAPDVEGQVIVDSIRSQNGSYLDNFPENILEGPGVAVMTWGSGFANSLDSFGNLETAPPVTVGGVSYPHGRTYFGGDTSYHPSTGMSDFLESQLVQDMFMPDSTWLCVGHVDEFTTFVPDASSDKGFKMLVSDVDVAWDLLDSLDPSQSIPKYTSAHGYSTIGDLTGDTSLRSFNDDMQQDWIEPALATYMQELGLDESDIIRVPGIWEENRWCPPNSALSLIPGLINLAVYTDEGGKGSKLLIADPFLRGTSQGQDDDPMIALWDSLMPAGNETYYLDDWSVYHEGMGEVHCGTNIRRVPTDDWWTTSTHLLGGSR